ncbi:MAG: M23 family metallopeptidase [Cyclobacteriaceae bacterium]
MITYHTRQFIRMFANLMIDLYRSRRTRKYLWIPLVILGAGLSIPQNIIIPVQGATPSAWNENSFWAYPWGKSITHKGVDIFADQSTPVVASTAGLVVWTGHNGMGGNSVVILGPKWRFHYYAHLETIKAFTLKPVKQGSVIGTVGNTGNAAGKPFHLHYTISTPLPYFWRKDDTIQGWKKMFYLDPDEFLRPQNQ